MISINLHYTFVFCAWFYLGANISPAWRYLYTNALTTRVWTCCMYVATCFNIITVRRGKELSDKLFNYLHNFNAYNTLNLYMYVCIETHTQCHSMQDYSL